TPVASAATPSTTSATFFFNEFACILPCSEQKESRRASTSGQCAFRSFITLEWCTWRLRRCDGLITGYVATQGIERIRAQPAKAIQFELEEYRGIGLFAGHPMALAPHPRRPAAVAAVHDAAQHLRNATVLERIVDTRHTIPAPRERPLERH